MRIRKPGQSLQLQALKGAVNVRLHGAHRARCRIIRRDLLHLRGTTDIDEIIDDICHGRICERREFEISTLIDSRLTDRRQFEGCQRSREAARVALVSHSPSVVGGTLDTKVVHTWRKRSSRRVTGRCVEFRCVGAATAVRRGPRRNRGFPGARGAARRLMRGGVRVGGFSFAALSPPRSPGGSSRSIWCWWRPRSDATARHRPAATLVVPAARKTYVFRQCHIDWARPNTSIVVLPVRNFFPEIFVTLHNSSNKLSRLPLTKQQTILRSLTQRARKARAAEKNLESPFPCISLRPSFFFPTCGSTPLE